MLFIIIFYFTADSFFAVSVSLVIIFDISTKVEMILIFKKMRLWKSKFEFNIRKWLKQKEEKCDINFHWYENLKMSTNFNFF